MLRILLVLISLASVAYTQVPSNEACPDVTVQQNFQAADYLGVWYEYSSYPLIFEFAGKCITAEYTARTDGKIGVFNKMINKITGKPDSISGYATPDAEEPAKLTVYFPSTPAPTGSNYWVLSSDYKNYSVVWSCRDNSAGSIRQAWILTRERVPSDEVIEQANEVFDKNGISRKFLIKTSHNGCDETKA